MARLLLTVIGCSLLLSAVPGGGVAANPSESRPGRERTPVVVEVRGGGFHVGDAAIGAAAAVSLVLVVAGAVLYVHPSVGRRRQ